MDPPETSEASQETAKTVTEYRAFQQTRRRRRNARQGNAISPGRDDIYQTGSPSLIGIPEIPDTLPELIPTGLTPLTGASSDLPTTTSQEQASEHGEAELSDLELDDALNTVWAINHITTQATKNALKERIIRHLGQALHRRGLGEPPHDGYVRMAQNLAESEAVRYAQKRRDRGRTPSLPASSHYSISRPATPSGRTGQQQASPFPPTERGRSNIEIMVPSGPTDSTSQESGTRPPFNRPPPTEWGRRVESQRERDKALERGEETDIPD